MALKLLFLSFIVLPAVLHCTAQNKSDILPVKEFAKAIEQLNTVLIDVRTPEEFAESHIPHALNINWDGSHFDEEINKLDKHKPVYVYCKAGIRSAKAAARMQNAGFVKVYTLDGGIVAWKDAGMKVE